MRGMDRQLTFEQALRSREFEPDAPNYTPRISGIMHIEQGNYSYAMSILKSDNGRPDSCLRYTLHTRTPLRERDVLSILIWETAIRFRVSRVSRSWLSIPNDMEEFTALLWNNLNEDNKVSLFVRYIDIATGTYETTIVNKNQ